MRGLKHLTQKLHEILVIFTKIITVKKKQIRKFRIKLKNIWRKTKKHSNYGETSTEIKKKKKKEKEKEFIKNMTENQS